MNPPPLKQRVVLVIEDESVIAMHVVSALQEAGADAAAAPNLTHAMRLSQTMDFNAAIVDVHLRGGDCRNVCRYLSKSGVPFLFFTGYGMNDIFDEWPQALVITKPTSDEQLIYAVKSLAKAPDKRP